MGGRHHELSCRTQHCSYEELEERCDAATAGSIRTRESLRNTEQRIADFSLLGKQIDTYRKLKPVYDRYKASKDKKKFLPEFESESILFEAAAREIKKAGLTKLNNPTKSEQIAVSCLRWVGSMEPRIGLKHCSGMVTELHLFCLHIPKPSEIV